MRGAPQLDLAAVRRLGIIPAYAGSTLQEIHCEEGRRDHPRVCGEHRHVTDKVGGVAGSSPRMRGARNDPAAARARRRIIPAYAGSTSMAWSTAAAIWDHPRVCGEHEADGWDAGDYAGSSPRMRGALTPIFTAACSAGIIPAYAGSTGNRPACGHGWRDHPRVCGEHQR